MPKRTAGGDGKRYPLNMRTTRALRERIEAAALASGRSLVQEVEYRLERSFIRDDFLLEEALRHSDDVKDRNERAKAIAIALRTSPLGDEVVDEIVGWHRQVEREDALADWAEDFLHEQRIKEGK